MRSAISESIPDVTIIMQCYNELRWLPDTISAVSRQTHKSFEFLIIDDGSTDGSQAYLSQIDDPRIRVTLHRSRKSWIVNMNAMASVARGVLIKLLCPDDVLKPGCLSAGMEFYRQHPDVGYIVTERDMIDEAGRRSPYPSRLPRVDYLTPAAADREMFYHGCFTNTSGLFVPRQRWVEAGGLIDLSSRNLEKRPVCEDFELMVRLQAKHPVGIIKTPQFDERFCANRALSNPSAQPMIAEVTAALYAILEKRIRDSRMLSEAAIGDRLQQVMGDLAHQSFIALRKGYMTLGLRTLRNLAKHGFAGKMAIGWLKYELLPRLNGSRHENPGRSS